MATAISSGVDAPRLSPTGLWILAMSASPNPASWSRATRLACVPRLPIAPMYPVGGAEQRGERRVLELGIVGEADRSVAGSELEAGQRLIRPRGHQALGVRDALEHC